MQTYLQYGIAYTFTWIRFSLNSYPKVLRYQFLPIVGMFWLEVISNAGKSYPFAMLMWRRIFWRFCPFESFQHKFKCIPVILWDWLPITYHCQKNTQGLTLFSGLALSRETLKHQKMQSKGRRMKSRTSQLADIPADLYLLKWSVMLSVYCSCPK